MGKRTAYEANSKAHYDDAQRKRQRVENHPSERKPTPPGGAPTEVTSARELKQALVFEQGTATSFRSGLSILKKFLDSILYASEDHDLPRKRAILREYLDSQKKASHDEKEASFLPNFVQAWDYAAETNFEALLSHVTASLALLLKVLASHADFLEYGTLLCKALLQPSVARRMHRSLSAAPNKENVIAPVLRLLTEITKYNQGAHAKAVYIRRDFTLEPKILRRNISLWRESTGDSSTDQRKPSIRSTAVRYFLSHLRFQDEVVKTEILENRNVVRAVFDHLQTDPPFLIGQILDVMKNHVFMDKAIQRWTKNHILTHKTLSNIAGLYRYQSPDQSPVAESEATPDVLAHQFLLLVCTSPAYGIMLPSHGYYAPKDDEDDEDVTMEDMPDFRVDLLDPLARLEGRVSVRNKVLAEFAQTLRPYASTLQQELLLAIFKASPELTADYFLRKESFQYDPSLTSTWIGYSAFLYQAIQLPVPPSFGAGRRFKELPPQPAAVIQSIMPQPLSQQVLVKCLNHSSNLISFFAVRILIVAFQKLRAVLHEFNKTSALKTSSIWRQSSQTLVSEFRMRCPPMKAVITASRRPEFHKDMMREAITRLLRLYYEVTPQVALQEKFDVSVALCNALIEAEKPTETPEDKALRIMELEHWIQIARHSPAMRWWQKTKSLQYSPFITLLKLIATSSVGDMYSGIKELLATILQEHDMLQMSTFPTGFDALIASLAPSCGSSSPHQVFEFLDDCCARFLKAPMKYCDDLACMCVAEADVESSHDPISPFLMTLLEQWPFKGGKPEKNDHAEPLAHWLSKLLYLLQLIGEDQGLLERVRDGLVESAHHMYQEILKSAFQWKMGKEKAKEILQAATGFDFSGSERSSTSPMPSEKQQVSKEETDIASLELPPEEDEKHTGLTRWRKKELEECVEDGDVGDLILCLCSKHPEIRLQAVSSLKQLAAKVEMQDDKSRNLLQLKLLLGELLETVRLSGDSTPLTYVGGVFAARAINVLTDPTHFLYGKVNKFLIKRPYWDVAGIPRYFARNILNIEPEEDKSYHREVDWYLEYMIDCLRTTEDMEVFRSRNVFERILSYYASPACTVSAREKIIRLLLRATAVGGSTTLITRCGLLDFLQIRLGNNDHRHRMLRLLASRLYDTCDKEKVDEWSGGRAKLALAKLSVPRSRYV